MSRLAMMRSKPARGRLLARSTALLLAAAIAWPLGLAMAQAQALDTKPVSDEELRLITKGTTPGAQDDASAEDADAAKTPADPSTSTVEPVDPNAIDSGSVVEETNRENLRENGIDQLRPRTDPDAGNTPGIALGTFVLRPAVTETIGIERTTIGNASTTRTYLQSGLKGSLVSDWSSHELKVDAEGTWQKTLSGQPKDNPEGKIDATLRLDIANSTIANLKAGLSMKREDVTDPNAVANAVSQAEVRQYTTSAEITHDLGLIRGTAGIDFTRDEYGPAALANGKYLLQKDRNQNTAILRGRLGYEISPALIPFIEASMGKSLYDLRTDSLGYRRDATLYAAKAGIAADFGEKLRGELAGGYSVTDFEDARLRTLSAFTVDGNLAWSPQRGTDITLGLKTEIEPSTTAGASGSVAYTANAALTQQILDSLTGRLTGTTTWRDYSLASVNDQTVLGVGAGLSWGLSRSLDLNADVSWEHTTQQDVPTTDVFVAGIGLTLKR